MNEETGNKPAAAPHFYKLVPQLTDEGFAAIVDAIPPEQRTKPNDFLAGVMRSPTHIAFLEELRKRDDPHHIPEREHMRHKGANVLPMFPSGNTDMTVRETEEQRHAKRFGALVRERRKALNMRQDDLALVSNAGRRFIVELEAGKPTCQLGKALAVAAAVGLRPLDLMSEDSGKKARRLPDLPGWKEDDTP